MYSASCVADPRTSSVSFPLRLQIPTYLKEFMVGGSLGAIGLLSAIPWIVSAAVGVWGGSVSDYLAQKLKWRADT